jgi:enamine deaminase RidA (YjgF/YER057c/UK114 family)
MVAQVQQALPGILALTNRVNLVLDHTADVTSNLNRTLVAAHPMVTNFAGISGSLNHPGGLGEWVLNTNGAAQVGLALTNVNTLLAHTDTNLDTLVQDVAVTLIHLGNVTSNLDTQVADNPTAISNVVKIITDSDDFIQGLKRHWLLRSAFKHKDTNAPPAHFAPAAPEKK